MGKPKVLFHGSRFEIEDFLEPRPAKDYSKKDNSQIAVYATDRFECAVTMSLSGESPAFSNYAERNPKIVFMHQTPNPEKTTYVYEVPSNTFTETSAKHQWISKVKVPILKTRVFKTENLGNYWRLATEEEFNAKWKKFKYPAPYKEFFESREKIQN
jgi:hypothetical protein